MTGYDKHAEKIGLVPPPGKRLRWKAYGALLAGMAIGASLAYLARVLMQLS